MFKNIRKLRIEKGMTQRQLAAVLGITQQTINSYENNRSNPGYDLLIKMASFFGVSLDYLILDDHKPDDPGRLNSYYTKDEMTRHIILFRDLPAERKKAVDQIILLLYSSGIR